MLRRIIRAMFGRNKTKSEDLTAKTKSNRGQEQLDIHDVFSVSTIAVRSYIDRTSNSAIRNLKRALEQPGKIVGVYGPSKSGKTTFVRKVLTDRDAGFVIVSGQQITSVDDYWRQVAEKLKLAIETFNREQVGEGKASGTETAVGAKFATNVAGLGAERKYLDLSEKMTGTEVEREPINSIRSRCLEFLAETKTAVVLDDFHEIRDPKTRKSIVRDVKPAAGEETGKFVFVAIPKDAFLFQEEDEQIRNRFAFYEFPVWSEDELQQIARKGFALLGMQSSDRQIMFIERCSFGNPLNVQQICINVCTNLRDMHGGDLSSRVLLPEGVQTALEDFATEHKEFLSIIKRAEEAGKPNDKEKTYTFEGKPLNIYQIVFACISIMGAGGGGENGLLVKTIAKRITETTGTAIARERIERIIQALADVEFKVRFVSQGPNELGSKKPFVYSAEEKKIYVTNPIFRMFLLWGYRPSIGLENPMRNQFVDPENRLLNASPSSN